MRAARAQSGGVGVGADPRVLELRSADDWAVALANAARSAGASDLGDALRRASRALFHRKPGRHRRDDTASLAEMKNLVETGAARSVEHAGQLVAASIAEKQSDVAATKRLARKYREKFGTK